MAKTNAKTDKVQQDTEQAKVPCCRECGTALIFGTSLWREFPIVKVGESWVVGQRTHQEDHAHLWCPYCNWRVDENDYGVEDIPQLVEDEIIVMAIPKTPTDDAEEQQE